MTPICFCLLKRRIPRSPEVGWNPEPASDVVRSGEIPFATTRGVKYCHLAVPTMSFAGSCVRQMTMAHCTPGRIVSRPMYLRGGWYLTLAATLVACGSSDDPETCDGADRQKFDQVVQSNLGDLNNCFAMISDTLAYLSCVQTLLPRADERRATLSPACQREYDSMQSSQGAGSMSGTICVAGGCCGPSGCVVE